MYNRIDNLKKLGEYRPTVSVILINKNNKILIVNSTRDKKSWYFPQGGIKKSEKISETIKRELKEELNVNYNEYKITNTQVYEDKLDINFTNNRGRGYSKGKAFFFVSGKYLGNGNLIPKEDEILNYKWVTYDECKQLFNKNNIKKNQILKNSLKNLAQ
ncbi:NUDIX domain-containing protein [Candidatus Woesearchaeota archaeon]|jgi:putative (di)nucleoside polyphosphate hydrolase|nr:NUDIX domain-containing protein [Candidatus Woesearchaeota archaeon]